MKTRNGFVSNSSSASFIIVWRCINPEVDTVKEAVDGLTVDDSIVGLTQKLKSAAYRTVFFTGMLNTLEDFGPHAALMMMSLYMNPSYEIIDARVEEN